VGPVVVATSTLDRGLTRTATGRSHRQVAAAARLIVAAVSVVPIVSYLWVALRQLGYPYELEWMEGGSVEMVDRVLHGQSLYVAPTLHYVPYTYPPLYFWLSALVAHVTGIGFLPLRLVSFAASLGSLALLFFIVRRETRDAVAGLLAAGLFAAAFEVGGAWLDVGRVDSLFVFLVLAAVAVARRSERWPAGVATGGLVAAAVLTKQSALLAAGPMLVVLAVRRPRAGLPALGTVAVVVGATTLALQAATHGWYWWYTVDELRRQGTVPGEWARFVPRDLIVPTGWAVAMGVGGLVAALTRRPVPRALAFWVAVVGGLVAASWLSRVHDGGARDVLIPAYAAVALAAALGYDQLRRHGPRPRALVDVLLAAVVVVQVAVLFGHPSHLIPGRADVTGGRRFVAAVAATPGGVIVYDHPWYETLAHKPSWAQGEAVNDVLRAGPSAARRDLDASIAATLGSPSVTTVYVDNRGDAATLGPDLLDHYAVAGPRVFSCFDCFFPPTSVALRPYLRFVRRPGG